MIVVYSREAFSPPHFAFPFAPAVDTGKFKTYTNHTQYVGASPPGKHVFDLWELSATKFERGRLNSKSRDGVLQLF